MIHEIEDKQAELAHICEKFAVRRLELFGSAAAGNRFDPLSSDLDFLVEYFPLPAGRRADAYFGLLDALRSLFSRSVDLVMVSAIRNPYFQQNIAESRTTLYAA